MSDRLVFQPKLTVICLSEDGLPRTCKFIHCPRLPPIDPSTWMRTPRIDPPPRATRRTPSVDPPSATTGMAPSVDPNPGVGLWGVCQPGTSKSHRRNCRTGPFADALEK